MIYKFTVDKYVKCWLRKEVAINADNLKDACIKVLQMNTTKDAHLIENTADEIEDEDGHSIEIYTKDNNEPILTL